MKHRDTKIKMPKVQTRGVNTVGLCLFAALFFIVGGWATFAQISGAVVTQGLVNLPNKVKVVQHLEGGIINKVNVRNGDYVEEGQILAEVDVSKIAVSYSLAVTEIQRLWANISRLEAERDNNTSVNWQANVDIDGLISRDATQEQTQLDIFNGRRAALKNEAIRIAFAVREHDERIDFLRKQLVSHAIRTDIAKQKLDAKTELYEAESVTKNSMQTATIELMDLNEQDAKIRSDQKQSQNRKAQLSAELVELAQSHKNSVLLELGVAKAELQRQLHTARFAAIQIQRSKIRSPVSGEVQELTVHTTGAVVQAGARIMNVVPASSQLHIECALDPSLVDEVYESQNASITFHSLGSTSRSSYEGTVKRVAASATTSSEGRRFFRVDVELDSAEYQRLGMDKLLPGMIAEVQLETTPKTVVEYLVEPLTKQFSTTLKTM